MTTARIDRQNGRSRTRRIHSMIAALSLAGVLAACADPWVDRRREAGEPNKFVGASSENRPMICHRGNVDAEVQRLAVQECAKIKKTPVYVGTMRYQCTLFSPNISAFDCK